MAPEPVPPSDKFKPRSSDEELPPLEDADVPAEAARDTVAEDEPQLLDAASRALNSDTTGRSPTEGTLPFPAEVKGVGAEDGDVSDTGGIAAEPKSPQAPDSSRHEPKAPTDHDWANELSAHRIIVELKRIEAEVRRLIDDRDTKRKRRLGGTRRWLDLEDDIISWQHSGRFPEDDLRRLKELVIRRHYLFKRLRFLASTRPTWNT